MAQYHPTYKAFEYPELSRRITSKEYWEVVECARSLGLHRGIPLEYSD
jgi:putative pyruvate formate lyase activating enzyme